MLFYVVGNIANYQIYLNKIADFRPYQKNIAWGLAKVNLNFIQVHNFNKVEVAMLFYVVGNIVFRANFSLRKNNAKHFLFFTLFAMPARTKNALLFGCKKWLALARHTFVRMCNAFLCSRKYRVLGIYSQRTR